jgi:hypothetical protein
MKTINLENINILAGSEVVNVTPDIPFNDLSCEFLKELSNILMKHVEIPNYPDVMTFAFWCRNSNIQRLRKVFEDSYLRTGLGYVFHIAPSNIAVNFAFSYVFGLLSGNANIVRVPSKNFAQINIICESIEKLFGDKKFEYIKNTTAFIQYERNDDITSMLSINCNARIIWGGDQTIWNIKKLLIPPRSIDITFADRVSLCVINSSSILELKEKELNKLIDDFFNDTYLMDQNACSSPFLLVWYGEKVDIKAKNLFWETLSKKIFNDYDLLAVQSVDKFTLLCQQAIELDIIDKVKIYNNKLYIVGLNDLTNDIYKYKGKFGHFFEIDINKLDKIKDIINEKYQTITYFDMNKNELFDFVSKNRLLGIDRIVPIGQALQIDTIWDGYDTIKTLSRIIEVK